MYQTALPASHLRNYVSCFWEGELVIGANQSHTYHAIANSKVEWLFCYAGNYLTNDESGHTVPVPNACFYGQTNTSKQYTSTAVINGLFGVRLYAHAIPLLLNIPATEITNQFVDISALLKSQGAELADEIFQAASFAERVNIISAFLGSQIQRNHTALSRFEAFITSMNQSGRGRSMSVSELAAQVNLSQRQFERHFKYLTGFSAKTFFKITRFENLIEAIGCPAGSAPQNLTELALEHGYYDQAHLNRHFKEFTGISPSAYQKLQEVQEIP